MTARPQDVALLPCPFCGGRVFVHHGPQGIGYVTCGQRDEGSDGCGVVASFRPNKGGREAIAAWNTRANVTAALASAQAREEELLAEVERLQHCVDVVHESWENYGPQKALVAELGEMRRAMAAEFKRAERLAEALRAAEALAVCCMAVDGYSRWELWDMAEATLPTFRAALTTNAAQPGETM